MTQNERLKAKQRLIELFETSPSIVGSATWREYYEQTAEHFLDNGVIVPPCETEKWISVKEMVPKINEENPEPIPVLVYEYGYICVGQYGARSKYFNHFDKEFHVDGEASTGVTHWMPLPAPPEDAE